jgi:hypothetical protein
MVNVNTDKIPYLRCPEAGCGAVMVLRETKRFTKNGKPRLFYGCSMWEITRCPGVHGAHPDGKPLGVPADKETKQWRIKAHEVFDKLWKQYGLTREEAYGMLQSLMEMIPEQAHIGNFNAVQCQELIKKIEREFPGGRP